MTGLFDNAKVITTCTRAQLIEDGDLVDITKACEEMSIEPLFKWHMAMSSACWEKFVEWDEKDGQRTGAVQNQAGRLWDVLYMATVEAKKQPRGTDCFTYAINYVDRWAVIPGHQSREGEIKIHVGPGDDAKPVITFLLPGED